MSIVRVRLLLLLLLTCSTMFNLSTQVDTFKVLKRLCAAVKVTQGGVPVLWVRWCRGGTKLDLWMVGSTSPSFQLCWHLFTWLLGVGPVLVYATMCDQVRAQGQCPLSFAQSLHCSGIFWYTKIQGVPAPPKNHIPVESNRMQVYGPQYHSSFCPIFRCNKSGETGPGALPGYFVVLSQNKWFGERHRKLDAQRGSDWQWTEKTQDTGLRPKTAKPDWVVFEGWKRQIFVSWDVSSLWSSRKGCLERLDMYCFQCLRVTWTCTAFWSSMVRFFSWSDGVG